MYFKTHFEGSNKLGINQRKNIERVLREGGGKRGNVWQCWSTTATTKRKSPFTAMNATWVKPVHFPLFTTKGFIHVVVWGSGWHLAAGAPTASKGPGLTSPPVDLGFGHLLPDWSGGFNRHVQECMVIFSIFLFRIFFVLFRFVLFG